MASVRYFPFVVAASAWCSCTDDSVCGGSGAGSDFLVVKKKHEQNYLPTFALDNSCYFWRGVFFVAFVLHCLLSMEILVRHFYVVVAV